MPKVRVGDIEMCYPSARNSTISGGSGAKVTASGAEYEIRSRA